MAMAKYKLSGETVFPKTKYVTCQFGDDEYGGYFPEQRVRSVLRNDEWIGKISLSGGKYAAFLSIFGIGQFDTEEEALNAVINAYESPDNTIRKYAI